MPDSGPHKVSTFISLSLVLLYNNKTNIISVSSFPQNPFIITWSLDNLKGWDTCPKEYIKKFECTILPHKMPYKMLLDLRKMLNLPNHLCVYYLRELRSLPAYWHQPIGVGTRWCGWGTPSYSNYRGLSIPACSCTLVSIFMPYDWCL